MKNKSISSGILNIFMIGWCVVGVFFGVAAAGDKTNIGKGPINPLRGQAFSAFNPTVARDTLQIIADSSYRVSDTSSFAILLHNIKRINGLNFIIAYDSAVIHPTDVIPIGPRTTKPILNLVSVIPVFRTVRLQPGVQREDVCARRHEVANQLDVIPLEGIFNVECRGEINSAEREVSANSEIRNKYICALVAIGDDTCFDELVINPINTTHNFCRRAAYDCNSYE